MKAIIVGTHCSATACKFYDMIIYG